MTYDARESSTELGQPIELFDFRISTETFTWTTNPIAVTYNSITYLPMEITRESIQVNPEQRAEGIKITLPASTELVRRYINSVPGQRATLTIRRVHRNDGDNELIELFRGIVRTVGFSSDGTLAEILVLPVTSDLANAIPRFKYSSVCQHVLYDSACTVAQSLFRHQEEVTGISGDTLTIQGLAAKGDDWATGGFISLTNGDFRLIIAHTGDNIRLLLPFPDSPLGQQVDVFAGCDHSIQTCKDKFNNVENFGGFAWVPLRNIFSTGLQ